MAAQDSTNPAVERTLRVALAMRGGVSMAVWIGGVVAELDLVRRASMSTTAENDRAAIYRTLLSDANYAAVEFDILAGASAGGLNAVLFALAQSYGVVTDSIVRRTWETDGGLWDLIRTPSEQNTGTGRWSGLRAVDSVLSGDGRFLTLADTAVDEIASCARQSEPNPHRATPPESLSVELAATLLPDPDKQVTTARGGFSFTRRPGGLNSAYSTIPGLGDEGDTADIARTRLALAIRSTSSFPGAFEPATVYSSASNSSASNSSGSYSSALPNPTAPGTDRKPNMDCVFPFARAAPATTDSTAVDTQACTPFLLIDGGVFDNIPIDRAIRAIARAPASAPTERVLIYLDPQPPVQPEPIPTPPTENAKRQILHKQTAQLTRWLTVIRSGMSMKSRQESAQDEIAIIREHNAAALQLRGRTEDLAALLAANSAALPRIPVDTYIRSRIGTDAERFGHILTAPHTMLFTPPFAAEPRTPVTPLISLGITAALRDAYQRASAAEASDADENGDAENGDTDENNADHSAEQAAHMVMRRGDVCAALDATQFLIAWTRALEAAGVTTLGDVKRRLYRCGAVLRQARHLSVDVALASVAEQPSMWADTLLGALGGQGTLRITDVVDAALAAGNTITDDDFYCALSPNPAADAGTRGIGDAGTRGIGDAGTRGIGDAGTARTIPLLQAVWEYLDNHLADLVAASAAPDQPSWNDSLYSALRQRLAAEASHQAYAPYLAYDVIRLIAASGGSDSQSIIRYHQITGDEPPVYISDHIRELRDAAIAAQFEDWLINDVAVDQIDSEQLSDWMGRIDRLARAEDKLCGTALARFSGFLRWQWRANDWRWGRMDAAAGIVKLLTPDDPHADEAPREARKALRQQSITQLQKLIVDEDPTAQDIPARGFSAITGLASSYRVGLVTRTTSLVIRALQPASIYPSPVKKSLVIAGVAMLRVLPVLLGLLVDPLRLLIALAATLLTSIVLPGNSETGPVVWYVFATLTALVGFVLLVRYFAADSKWQKMRGRLETAVGNGAGRDGRGATWLQRLARADAHCRRYRLATAGFGIGCVGAGAAVTVATYTGVVTQHQIEPMLMIWFLVMAAAVRLARTCTRVVAAQHNAAKRGTGSIAIVLVGAVIVAPFADGWIPPAVPIYTAGVAAALCAILVTCSLWGWTSTAQLAAYAAPAAVLSGALSAGFAGWIIPDSELTLIVLVPIVVWWLYLAVLLGTVTPRSSADMGLLPPAS